MFTITVKPDGVEAFTVEATSRDVLNWERTNKGVNLKKLEQAPSMVDFYKIAHFAVQRTGQWAGSVDEFMATCEIEVEDDEADPTNAAP
ncbi:hypothetical protein [Saccharomonospora cyanea]|uniref:Uncharacterized protein n=1 Tax=Saccharomonospora cyanea NA-134 TaxID=882082 RepID=H5XG49_9PSEU|nr:hypothetical protein [Saccharomonospora cyanea]EHR62631.1 hypothetical protein SaccyDRAFT_3804 [Saccharomonospora cyanea NA-134]